MLEPVNEIPVGSPPTPTGKQRPGPGWYSDPVDASKERYWDGWQWSAKTRDRLGATTVGPTSTRNVPPRLTTAVHPDKTGIPHTADGVPLGPNWRRFAGLLLDAIILVPLSMVATFPIWARIFSNAYHAALWELQHPGRHASPASIAQTDLVFYVAVSILISTLYHGFFLKWSGATIGQHAARLRVVPYGAGHSAVDWKTAFARGFYFSVLANLTGVFSTITVPMFLLNGWFVVKTRDKKSWVDSWAGTQVIDVAAARREQHQQQTTFVPSDGQPYLPYPDLVLLTYPAPPQQRYFIDPTEAAVHDRVVATDAEAADDRTFDHQQRSAP